MGLQTIHNSYIVSEFGKAFANSKEQSNKKVNNNKIKNEKIKPKEKDFSEQINFFKKIADADKKEISSYTSKIVNNKKKADSVIIIPNRFFNNVYDGFNWNTEKYDRAWGKKDVSIASIYSQQHLPKDFKKSHKINRFPNSNILFGIKKPKPFNIPMARSPINERPKVKRLFYRKSISFKYISFNSIDNLRCFNISMDDLCKISRPPSYKLFPSTGSV
ncbi:hypothetical protein H8356DRAFT_1734176 [Neocallimastix lanati (nom. inval.)]|jgi:hypothetical protein|nr:hypothetical protein H8356DRAFT_1734176 [Neocallimastix sp. JGI-2020a]